MGIKSYSFFIVLLQVLFFGAFCLAENSPTDLADKNPTTNVDAKAEMETAISELKKMLKSAPTGEGIPNTATSETSKVIVKEEASVVKEITSSKPNEEAKVDISKANNNPVVVEEVSKEAPKVDLTAVENPNIPVESEVQLAEEKTVIVKEELNVDTKQEAEITSAKPELVAVEAKPKETQLKEIKPETQDLNNSNLDPVNQKLAEAPEQKPDQAEEEENLKLLHPDDLEDQIIKKTTGNPGLSPLTKILMSNGLEKQIQEIKVGDDVINPVSGKIMKVVNILETLEEFPIITISVGERMLRATKDLHIKTGNGIIEAKEINLLDMVDLNGTKAEVSDLSSLVPKENQRVFNLRLDGDGFVDNHMILADGFIVGDLAVSEVMNLKDK